MVEPLRVEVAYVTVDRAYCVPLKLPSGSTLRQAIEQSGLLQQCPDIDLGRNRVGVFGQLCDLDETLAPGDRVEIYRSLQIDPKAARRRRAAKRKER